MANFYTFLAVIGATPSDRVHSSIGHGPLEAQSKRQNLEKLMIYLLTPFVVLGALMLAGPFLETWHCKNKRS